MIVSPASSGLAAVVFGLSSAISFGSADFSGGMASKRAHVFGVLTVARFCGLTMSVALACMLREPLPSGRAMAWACAAGIAGGLSLPAFYRALAIGKMGIAASVTSVLAAAVPVVVAALTEGLPRGIQVVGLVLGLMALWFISRPEGEIRPEGLGLALLAGLGFGSFLVFIHQAGSDGVYWPMAGALGSSFVVSAGMLKVQRGSLPGSRVLPIVCTAGLLDTFGNILFVQAGKHGRLDVAAILSSLYPAVTVLLARLVLKERITRIQTAGMATALIAVPLIAAH